MLALNHRFVQRCLDVYDVFQNGPYSQLSWGWVRVCYRYQQNPKAYAALLPAMTALHILEDLEHALFYVEVAKADYDSIIDYIIECIETVRDTHDYLPSNLKELVVDYLANDFDPLRNWVVQELRTVAWNTAQMRKRLQQQKNLTRWFESGGPQRWVQEHGASWNHDDWLAYIRQLRNSEFWPLALNEIGLILEQIKAEFLKAD
jgi:hypothetical protein